MKEPLFDPRLFSGKAPLFPLPGVVLYPQMLLPLHVFEPRYRRMLEVALAGERLIGVVQIKETPEETPEEAPPQQPEIFSTLCLAAILHVERLPEGESNLWLLGVSRARIVRELELAEPFRAAELELAPDENPLDEASRHALESRLVASCQMALADQPDADDILKRILSSTAELSGLCNAIAACLPMEASLRQAILETTDVRLRAYRVLEWLRRQLGAKGAEPLPWSAN
ncbi:LON peptidase substrate-binding domain-containing protein [bacterium]|nr:LON peptidase substrate-binding domain-containing protein [bacterium]